MRVQGLRLATRGALALTFLLAAGCAGGDGTGVVRVTSIRFASQPTQVNAGVEFVATVELVGENGQRVTSADDPVGITMLGVAIAGSTTIPAVSGLATFSGLTVTQTLANAQLVATSGALQATSQAFPIRAGAVAANQSTVTPGTGPLSPYQANSFVFTFKDTYGNPVANASVVVTASLPSVTITPSSGNTTATGTFSTNVVASGEGTTTLSATVAGAPVSFTTPIEFIDYCEPTPLTFPGNHSGAFPTGSGCVLGGIPASAFGFTVGAPTAVAVTVTAQFSAIAEINTIPPVAVVGINPSPTIPAEWLLPPGNYQARIGAQVGTGQYTLTTALASATNTGCANRFLVRSIVITGQALAAGDCVLVEIDDSLYDMYVMLSTAACTITMRSSEMNAYLFVFDAITGAFIAEDDNSGGGVNGQDAQIQRPSCTSASGPVRIIANTWDDQSGAYTLEIAAGAAGGAGGALRAGPALAPQQLAIPAGLRAKLDARRALKSRDAAKRGR